MELLDLTGARGTQEHMKDRHKGKWDRFSWFGFIEVSDESDQDGVLLLSRPREPITGSTSSTIGDLEALLIMATGPKGNRKKMRFKNAKEWGQVGYWEWHETFQSRIALR